MKERVVLDVSALPLHATGAASPTWWGTCAFMLIEGTGFALALAVYFYLMSLAPHWPIRAPAPDPWPGTFLALILLASVAPNVLVSRWARQGDMRRVRLGLVVMCLFGIAPLFFRAYEFPALRVRWDDNAYGSITWTILGLHTAHIVTDLVDTLVLTCLMFTRHGDNPRRFGDVEDNALYWNFVVVTWIPLYASLYWVPRL
ncbi:MAG TPA: cytochrome c oxidase subunit 3 [Shinella sp.]|jgi:heme/copper-type cytochrome/quinol oxidase subunit 3|uniref:cytochrome c oxidase subunit 3 n=1 Tax=Shinella sp. TaxID=1870904 RepID=UPI002E124470|nr:cytochrome c oxidase subunit 3 [Shinella sp.]